MLGPSGRCQWVDMEGEPLVGLPPAVTGEDGHAVMPGAAFFGRPDALPTLMLRP